MTTNLTVETRTYSVYNNPNATKGFVDRMAAFPAENATALMKFGAKISSYVNSILPDLGFSSLPVLDGLKNFFVGGLLPSGLTVLPVMANATVASIKKASQDLTTRNVVAAVDTTGDTASLGFALASKFASLSTATSHLSSPLGFASDLADFVQTGAALKNEYEDWTNAAKEGDILAARRLSSQKTADDAALTDSEKMALSANYFGWRTLKNVISITTGALSFYTLFTKKEVLPKYVQGAMSVTSAALGVYSAYYKHTVPIKPISVTALKT